MTRICGALARIPNSVLAGLLVVAGVQIVVHDLWLAHIRETGAPEPAQWLAFLLLKWYWVFLPVTAVALWARRRTAHGALGCVGAWMNLIGGPAEYAVLLVGSLVWGLLLGRGDLPGGVMAVELLTYLILPGMLLAGVAMLRDRGCPRWQGALVTVLPLAAWVPFGALTVGLLLGGLLLTKGRSLGPALDSPVAATAP